jgi:uridylate kinase
MDSTALSLCMENRLPVVVFGLKRPESIVRAASGDEDGTTRVADVTTEIEEPSATRT